MREDEFRASEAERWEMADLSDRFEASVERAAGSGAELDRAVAEGRWSPDHVPAALTPEQEADLRERVTALTEGEGITPGPWHAIEDGDKAAYGFWLDNEAGDSSFPSPEDVAVFVNALPPLLAELTRLRAALSGKRR